MPISDLTSRAAVQEAMAEFRDLGREAFLAKYGFGPALQYYVEYRGRLYDSKALAGVAYGKQYPSRGTYTADRFTGGAQTAVATLRKLDFRVVSHPRAGAQRAFGQDRSTPGGS